MFCITLCGPRTKKFGDPCSRLMPGAKDFVSISHKVHQQKCLVFCTLKELYAAFANNHPTAKIGLAKFCSRSKWCILPGAYGSHSAFVCSIHQNAQFIAMTCGMNHKDMMKMIVCDLSNKQCMLHRCSNCPGKKILYILQLQQLSSFTEYNEVVFKQSESTDKANLNTLTLLADEFIELAACKIDSLTAHSFNSKTQTQYLKPRKESLPTNTAIVLADFVEDYSFVSKMKYKATTGTNNSALCIQLLRMQMTVITFVKPLLSVSFLMTSVMTLDLFMLFKRFH